MANYTDTEQKELEVLQVTGEKPEASDPVEIRGVSGTPLNASFNPLELNPALIGSYAWTRTVREMLLDPAISSTWSALKGTLLSAKYDWLSAEPGDPEADKYAEYAKDMWNRMDVPWEQQLQYILEYLNVGFRYAEILYKTEDGKIYIRNFADREPSSHSRWVREPDNGTLVAVTQNAGLGARIPKPMPASKLLLLTNSLTGQNFAGVGLLRPLYKSWKLKNHCINQIGIGAQRWSTPLLAVDVDRSKMAELNYSAEQIDEAVRSAKAEAQAYVSMEQGYVVRTPAVGYSIIDGTTPAANGIGELREVITMMNNEIFTSMLVQFLTLGTSDSGSRGVSETMETFFRRAAINYLDNVVGTINGPARPGGGVIGRLLDFNFSNVDQSKLPKLIHSGLDIEPVTAYLNQLGSLVRDELITKSADLETSIRKAIGLEQLQIEEQAAIIEAEDNPSVAYIKPEPEEEDDNA